MQRGSPDAYRRPLGPWCRADTCSPAIRPGGCRCGSPRSRPLAFAIYFRPSRGTRADAGFVEHGCPLCAAVGSFCGLAGNPDRLVNEDGHAVTDSPGAHLAQRLLVTHVAKQALPATKHYREHHQTQLVDEVLIEQRLG